MLVKQKPGKLGDLAKSERLNRSYFSRLLRLACNLARKWDPDLNLI